MVNRKKTKIKFRTKTLEQPRDAIRLTDSQEFINNNPEAAQTTQDLNHWLKGSVYTIKFNQIGYPVGVVMNDNEEVPDKYLDDVLSEHSKLYDMWHQAKDDADKALFNTSYVSSSDGDNHNDFQREQFYQQQKSNDYYQSGKQNFNTVLNVTRPGYVAERIFTATDQPVKNRQIAGLTTDLTFMILGNKVIKVPKRLIYSINPKRNMFSVTKLDTPTFNGKYLSKSWSENGYPYLFNPETKQWETGNLSDLIRQGRQETVDWINSSAYRQAAEQNVIEAEQMGLHYTPTYEKPEFNQKYKVTTYYDPKSDIGGSADGNGDITYNLGSNMSPQYVSAHEHGHSFKHGNVSESLMASDPKLGMKEHRFLKTKSSKIFKPNSYYGDFDLSVTPVEAVMNTRDIGKDLGLKIGQEYPGYEQALQIIKSYPKNSPKSGLINYLKLDEESMPYVWKALTGTLFSTLPIQILKQNE